MKKIHGVYSHHDYLRLRNPPLLPKGDFGDAVVGEGGVRSFFTRVVSAFLSWRGSALAKAIAVVFS